MKHGDPLILLLQSMCLCLKCIRSKYFKTPIIFHCSLISLIVKPFFHTNTCKYMSSQGNVKGNVFEAQAWRYLIFMFYFEFLAKDDSACKKLEKLDHKFNYAQT